MARKHPTFDQVLLTVLACLLPLVVIFMMMLSGSAISPIWFWLALLLCFGVMFYYMRGAPIHGGDTVEHDRYADERLPSASVTGFGGIGHGGEEGNEMQTGDKHEVMQVEESVVETVAEYERLKRQLAGSSHLPLLQEDERGRPLLMVVSYRRPEAAPQRLWVHVVLFVLTLATTTWTGAAHRGVDLLKNPEEFTTGLPYALALLAILGTHELGHYFAARAHGMDVTLPYFIPVPFALGTFGAFIQMRSPAPTRRALFDMAIAGPLAGLVIAIPALLIGLQYSTVGGDGATSDLMHGGTDIGSSVLLALMAKLSLGDTVAEGHRLVLHPIAFAGWLGIFITALNLLPIGQLDGGHVAHALFGRRKGDTIGTVALFALVLLGLFVWSGLLMWAIIVFFMAGAGGMPPLEDVTPVDRRRAALGAFAFVLLFLILTPVPHAFQQALGIRCPYV